MKRSTHKDILMAQYQDKTIIISGHIMKLEGEETCDNWEDPGCLSEKVNRGRECCMGWHRGN